MKKIKISAEDERSLRNGVTALYDLVETIKVLMQQLGEPVEEIK